MSGEAPDFIESTDGDTPRAVPRRKPWLRALGCFVLALAGAGVLGALSRASLAPEVYFLAAMLLVSGCLALVAFGAAGFARALDTREALGLVRGIFDARATGVAALGLISLSVALAMLLGELGLSEQSEALRIVEEALDAARHSAPWLAVLAIGIAPGFAEELLCRGYILGALHRRRGKAFALLASSAVFALLHLDPVHSGFAFAVGLFLGWVTLLARSIGPAVMSHVANNVLAVLWQFFLPEPDLPTPLALALVALLFALALGSLVWLTRHARGLRELSETNEASETGAADEARA